MAALCEDREHTHSTARELVTALLAKSPTVRGPKSHPERLLSHGEPESHCPRFHGRGARPMDEVGDNVFKPPAVDKHESDSTCRVRTKTFTGLQL